MASPWPSPNAGWRAHWGSPWLRYRSRERLYRSRVPQARDRLCFQPTWREECGLRDGARPGCEFKSSRTFAAQRAVEKISLELVRPTGLVTWAALRGGSGVRWRELRQFSPAGSKAGAGALSHPCFTPDRTAALRFAEQLVSSTARIGCGTRSALGETKDGDPKRGLRLPLYARQDSNL